MMATSAGELTAYGAMMTIMGITIGIWIRGWYATVSRPVASTRYQRAQEFLDACTLSMITRMSVNLDAYGVGRVIVDSVESQDKSGYNFVLTTAGGQKHSVIIS